MWGIKIIQYNIFDAETNLTNIIKTLEDRKEDCIILTRNDKPTIKMALIEENSRKYFFGCAKGLFEVPDDFDEIDISKDFTSEIFPKWKNIDAYIINRTQKSPI